MPPNNHTRPIGTAIKESQRKASDADWDGDHTAAARHTAEVDRLKQMESDGELFDVLF